LSSKSDNRKWRREKQGELEHAKLNAELKVREKELKQKEEELRLTAARDAEATRLKLN